MAKQVLDLYELFRLVASKGGLVEVINKKLWREITKGLNLPSSITSAAFTLRTQYMKYLYPYECETLKLSSPGELQTAIDGNRREARRPSYSFEYPLMLGSGGPSGPVSVPPGLSSQMCQVPPPPSSQSGVPPVSSAASIGALFAAHCQQNFAGAAAAAAVGLMASGAMGGGAGGMGGGVVGGPMRSPVGALRLPAGLRDNRLARMPLGLKQESTDSYHRLSPRSAISSEADNSLSPSQQGLPAHSTTSGINSSKPGATISPGDYAANCPGRDAGTPTSCSSPSLSQKSKKRSANHLSAIQSSSSQHLSSSHSVAANNHHGSESCPQLPTASSNGTGEEANLGHKMAAPGGPLAGQNFLTGMVPSQGGFPQPPPRSGFFPPNFPSIQLPTSHMRMATQPGSHLGMPENALVVSMDMNGLLYQGVLFAQPKRF